jgi:hypothetical protein
MPAHQPAPADAGPQAKLGGIVSDPPIARPHLSQAAALASNPLELPTLFFVQYYPVATKLAPLAKLGRRSPESDEANK